MPLPRVRFTLRWLMGVVVVLALVFAVIESRVRRRDALNLKVAEASYQSAKLTRQVAEIAVVEYVKGVYKADLAAIEGEILEANSDRARLQQELNDSTRGNHRYGDFPVPSREKLALQRAIFRAEQAETSKKVLEHFTKEKTIRELNKEIAKARAVEAARLATVRQIQANAGGLLGKILGR